MDFEVFSKPVKHIDFATELQQAITPNLEVLKDYRAAPLLEAYEKFILCLSLSEM